MVPQEYHEYLDVFEEGEKTKRPPYHPGVDLEIKLEEGEGLAIKKIYALSQDELKELWSYIKQNEERGWIRETYSDGGSLIMFVKKKDGKLRLCVEFVTGRGGAGFHSPGPALTTGRGGYFGGDPRPAPIRGESPLIPWMGPRFSPPVLTRTRLGNGRGRGQGQGTVK